LPAYCLMPYLQWRACGLAEVETERLTARLKRR
jgi:hypothetical protein